MFHTQNDIELSLQHYGLFDWNEAKVDPKTFLKFWVTTFWQVKLNQTSLLIEYNLP